MYEDRLRSVPLFEDLSDDDLTRLCQGVHEVRLEAGDILFREGEPGDTAYVILEGELEIHKQSEADRPVLVAVRTAGEVIGEMALIQSSPRSASASSPGSALLIGIPKQTLDDLLITSPSAVRTVFEAMLQRWKDTQSRLRQSERMAQLGTLSAGLAHELNNPAAAAKRAADQLEEAVAAFAVAVIAATSVDGGTVETLIQDVLTRSSTAVELSALARADAEESVEDWLTARGVPEGWRAAPTLVALGYTESELEAMMAAADPADSRRLLDLITRTHDMETLRREVAMATGRISSIVGALKSYSYLDQAPVQEVDLTRGIMDTLTILKQKLTDVKVETDFHPELRPIHAYGSELNQVWTNLIDNAADAVAGRPEPTIRIRAFPNRDGVTVEIQDNGEGIPDSIRHRVFDSFFTTKAPGSGTGLGLDISRGIVIDRHGGEIEVESQPGKTLFSVWLPLEPAR